MSIEEAREAAMRQLSRAIPTKKGDNDRTYYLCEKAVDAYAAARALAAHVEACRNWKYADPAGASQAQCGEGWLCEKAKRIEELT